MSPVCRNALAAIVAIGLCSSAGTAFAGDCKNVVFKFTNNTGAKVKVKYVDYSKHQNTEGNWRRERFTNITLDTGATDKTGKRNLGYVDSGEGMYMRVGYDRWDSANNKYKVVSQFFFDWVTCTDEKTFSFTLDAFPVQ